MKNKIEIRFLAFLFIFGAVIVISAVSLVSLFYTKAQLDFARSIGVFPDRKLTGWRKTAAFLFAVIVPVTMLNAKRLGTFDQEGKWGTLPMMETESRAQAVDRAINWFYAEHGSYPQTLEELTPRYLLYLPVPYMIRGQDWCYEGGESYYRFGYVCRKKFSLPASVRIHATEGEPPDPAWECDEETAKYQQVPGF